MLEASGDDQPIGRRLADRAARAEAEAPGVDASAVVRAGDERDPRRGRDAHVDLARGHLDLLDLRTAGAVAPAASQRVEHTRGRSLGRAHHRPGKRAVVARQVRVVGGDRGAAPARLQHLVPEVRGEAARAFELASGVVHLDAEHVGGVCERGDRRAGPAGVREQRDAAVLGDPARGLSERRERLPAIGDRVDAEGEHVPVRPVWQPRVQLGARNHDQPVGGITLDLGACPVIGRRQHVEARAAVVRRERPRRQLTVGVRRVGVQSAAEPLALGGECVHAVSLAGASGHEGELW